MSESKLTRERENDQCSRWSIGNIRVVELNLSCVLRQQLTRKCILFERLVSHLGTLKALSGDDEATVAYLIFI